MSVLEGVGRTVLAEFSDLPDVEQLTRVAVRLLMALVVGAMIGWEREYHRAEAGLRTHMLVSLGAALFVIVPTLSGMSPDAASRVIQGLVSGIGFLGAGAVLKMSDEGRIHGLTTAATIWVTAALGVAAGVGRESTALLSAVLMLVVLVVLRRLDKVIHRHTAGHHEHGRDRRRTRTDRRRPAEDESAD